MTPPWGIFGNWTRVQTLAGKLLLERGGHDRRDEGRTIAAHGGNLANETCRDMPRLRRGGQKHRLDLRRKGLVHAGHLHLVVEIAGVAQAPDDDRGLRVLSRIDSQIIVSGYFELEADLPRHGVQHL